MLTLCLLLGDYGEYEIHDAVQAEADKRLTLAFRHIDPRKTCALSEIP